PDRRLSFQRRLVIGFPPRRSDRFIHQFEPKSCNSASNGPCIIGFYTLIEETRVETFIKITAHEDSRRAQTLQARGGTERGARPTEVETRHTHWRGRAGCKLVRTPGGRMERNQGSQTQIIGRVPRDCGFDAHDAHHPAGTELFRSLDCGMDPPSGGSGTLLVSKNRGPAWSVQPGLERPSHRETTVLWAARGPDGYARARHRLRRRLFLFRG